MCDCDQKEKAIGKTQKQKMKDPEGFRRKETFYEVILDDCPEAVMIFSMRLDRIPSFVQLPEHETENKNDLDYHFLSRQLNIDPSRIVFIEQVHGSKIVNPKNEPEPFVGDAVITDETNCYPSIKTADCQSILIIDPIRKVTAAIHAGWKGTVQRITRKVILELETAYGCSPSDLIAALGPSVGTCCYEVDEKVIEPFRKSAPDADRFIESYMITDPISGVDRISSRLDLRRTNKHELLESGVNSDNIKDLDLCTQCHDTMFYSYRRDGANPGRLIALAGFRL